jgi:CheY-like chemotaxis protein
LQPATSTEETTREEATAEESAAETSTAMGFTTAASEATAAPGAIASGTTTASGGVSGVGTVLPEETSSWPPPAFEPRRAQRALPHAEAMRTVGELTVGEPGLAPMVYGAVVATTSPSRAGLASAQPALAVAPVRRALVVDDDPEVRRALARFLRPELDVALAGSVSDAKAIVARLDRLDVAFVDWELPDGNGEQILEWLSRWPDAIRVLISARFASSGASPSSPFERGDASSEGAAAPSPVTPRPGAPGGAPREWPPECSTSRIGEKQSDRTEDPMKSNPLKNRALANLVLGKPVATSVIEALKRAALALPND